MILREPYTRKSYITKSGKHISHSLTPPTCIKKRGKTNLNLKSISKTNSRVIVLDPEDHLLSEYGYHNVANLNKSQRRDALHKLIKHFLPIKGKMATYNYVIRALNARYILNRNTNPKIANIMKQDQKYISRLYSRLS